MENMKKRYIQLSEELHKEVPFKMKSYTEDIDTILNVLDTIADTEGRYYSVQEALDILEDAKYFLMELTIM